MEHQHPTSKITIVRAMVAIAVCKLLRRILQITGHGGTNLPGKAALMICPNILTLTATGIRTIIVSGTNGKTTTCRLIEQGLQASGISLFANRSGANLLAGIVTAYVINAKWNGVSKKKVAVIECDEASLKLVLDYISPEVIVLTNIFRDQLDRYGEVTHTLEELKTAIDKAPGAKLCLNADDSLVSSVADVFQNSCVFFGINSGNQTSHCTERSDAMYCKRCKHRYSYSYVTYAHLGGFYCPNCGYERPEANVAVNAVIEENRENSVVELSIHGRTVRRTIPLPALYNVYNYLAALTAVTAFGLADLPELSEGEKEIGFGRMEHFDIGAGVTMILVKNPTGFTQVIEYLSNLTEEYDLLCCLNDNPADGTDISWIWDVPLEMLSDNRSRVHDIYVAGTRKEDLYLRFKYSGFPMEYLHTVDKSQRFIRRLEQHARPVVIVPTYTAMMELRRILARKTGSKAFWE